MNISRIITSLALINPFAVKVAAMGDALVAYRSVFGVLVPVTGKSEERAIVDYVSRETIKADRITKAMIGSPFAFVDQHQGELLQALMTPPPSPILASKAVPVNTTIRFAPLSAKLAGKRPQGATQVASAVDRHLVATAQAAYQAKLDELD